MFAAGSNVDCSIASACCPLDDALASRLQKHADLRCLAKGVSLVSVLLVFKLPYVHSHHFA